MPARTQDQLGKKAISHLRMLQKKPKRVKKYFELHLKECEWRYNKSTDQIILDLKKLISDNTVLMD